MIDFNFMPIHFSQMSVSKLFILKECKIWMFKSVLLEQNLKTSEVQPHQWVVNVD